MEPTQEGVPAADTPTCGRVSAPQEASILLIAHPEHRRLGARYRLTPQAPLEIGRAPLASVSLPEVPSLSRRHARLWFSGEVVHIEDLRSRNGTYVNDRRIGSSAPLGSGDRFQLGAVHFKLLHEQDIEHAYHQAIHELLERDGLTGAHNRRKLLEEGAREVARARRHRRPLSLVMVDIDLFKRINDQYGHLAGDAVLKQLVDRCATLVRAEEVFARLGGEEFALLCPEAGSASAFELAEKLRRLCEDSPFDAGGRMVRLSVSCGVAAWRPEMERLEDLLAAADGALYEAKRTGRNRTCIATRDEGGEDTQSPG